MQSKQIKRQVKKTAAGRQKISGGQFGINQGAGFSFESISDRGRGMMLRTRNIK